MKKEITYLLIFFSFQLVTCRDEDHPNPYSLFRLDRIVPESSLPMDTVVLYGAGFSNSMEVNIATLGLTNCKKVLVTDNSVAFVVPNLPSGNYPVVAAIGTKTITSTFRFEIIRPSIKRFLPFDGNPPGGPILLNGSNLQTIREIKVNGLTVGSYGKVIADTFVTFNLPSGLTDDTAIVQLYTSHDHITERIPLLVAYPEGLPSPDRIIMPDKVPDIVIPPISAFLNLELGLQGTSTEFDFWVNASDTATTQLPYTGNFYELEVHQFGALYGEPFGFNNCKWIGSSVRMLIEFPSLNNGNGLIDSYSGWFDPSGKYKIILFSNFTGRQVVLR